MNADTWTDEELMEVIGAGETLLNISFDQAFRLSLIEGCFESVSVVQDACYRVCADQEVNAAQAETVVVGADVDAASIIRSVVDQQSARYNAFISQFAAGFMQTDLEMYKYLLYPVLKATPDELEAGIPLTEINRTLKEVHPRGGQLNPGNVTQALKSAASLQIHLKIQPLILDYHQSARRLSVVDKGFLIWVTYQDRDELLRTADIERASPSNQLPLSASE